MFERIQRLLVCRLYCASQAEGLSLSGEIVSRISCRAGGMDFILKKRPSCRPGHGIVSR
jgi:hypothetical protein